MVEWPERAGSWLHQRIRGAGSAHVESRPRAKSISRDETFAKDISSDEYLAREVLRLADRATSDLRRHQWAAQTVTVKVRDHDFKTRQKSRTLKEAVISDRMVASVAQELLDKLRARRRVPVRLLGVSLSNLKSQESLDQLSLFEPLDDGETETARDRALARALDEVRDKFGRGALGRGT